MRGQLRAKYRCMGVEKRWDDTEIIKLAPVIRGSGQDPENEKFWSATPDGEAELVYIPPEDEDIDELHPFTQGDYYYIDMIPADEQSWRLNLELTSDGGAHATFKCYFWKGDTPLRRGTFKASIDADCRSAIESLGRPSDGGWELEFTWAEASDDYMNMGHATN